jgi:phage-related tail fiber protein
MTQIDRSEGLVGNTAIKAPCRLASTANVPTLNGLLTIDGVVTAAGDRVLLTAQTSGVDNGIYVADTGDWERAQDCDGTLDLAQGSLVNVTSGSANAGFWYVTTTTDPIVVGTTSLSFSMASSALAVVSAFMQTVLDDTTAAAACATLRAVYISGASVAAHATTSDIWQARYNTLSGSVVTFTDVADAPYAGSVAIVVANAAHVLTDNANLEVQGNADYTCAAGDVLIFYAKTTSTFQVSIFRENGRAVVDSTVLATAVATTSGTIKTFTAPRANVVGWCLSLMGVSTGGTTPLGVQIGDAGGTENSGYSGGGGDLGGATVAANNTCWQLGTAIVTARLHSGTITGRLADESTNTWAVSGIISRDIDGQTYFTSGDKTLTGGTPLTTVSITSVGGDTFDAGKASIQWFYK